MSIVYSNNGFEEWKYLRMGIDFTSISFFADFYINMQEETNAIVNK